MNFSKRHFLKLTLKLKKMTTKVIADKLVEACRTGKYEDAYAMYAPHCRSIEPEGSPWKEAVGMEEIAKKGKQWQAMVEEVHSGYVSDPIVADGWFSCQMKNDVTFKEGGRKVLDEVCVYEVKDGQIVREQFFYNID